MWNCIGSEVFITVTVQLKCKVMFEHFQSVCKTCPERAQDVFGILTRCIRASVNLVIKLQQDLIHYHALFARCGTCLEHLRDAPGMCERCIPDTCKCYVAFKLYRMTWKWTPGQFRHNYPRFPTSFQFTVGSSSVFRSCRYPIQST